MHIICIATYLFLNPQSFSASFFSLRSNDTFNFQLIFLYKKINKKNANIFLSNILANILMTLFINIMLSKQDIKVVNSLAQSKCLNNVTRQFHKIVNFFCQYTKNIFIFLMTLPYYYCFWCAQSKYKNKKLLDKRYYVIKNPGIFLLYVYMIKYVRIIYTFVYVLYMKTAHYPYCRI